MASIDQLNFEVILDDTQFNRRIQVDQRLAQALNRAISDLLDIRRQDAQTTRDQVQAEKDLIKELEKHLDLAEQIRDTGVTVKKHTSEQGRIMKELTGIVEKYVSVWGASQLVQNIVRVTGEFEKQRQALRSMIGDIDGADSVFSRFKGLALQSPFTFMDLTTYAKQLTAFSIPMNELYDTTKMLADVSAGLGVSMDRIILAYGQVRAATVLRGQELRQFTEAGVPILDLLAKKLSEVEGHMVTTGEVFDRVSKKQVSFDMVKDAFIEMTSEGGKFYNMQEVLSETVAGKVMKLKDAYEILLNDIGESTSGVIKGVLDAVTNLMRNSNELLRIIRDIAIAFGIYKMALFAMTYHIHLARAASVQFGKVIRSLNKTLLANPYAIAAAAIAGLAYALIRVLEPTKEMNAAMKRLNKSVVEMGKSIDRELDKLDDLRDTLLETEKGTDEWKKAKDQVVSQYGQYFNGLDQEITRVGNLETAYQQLAIAIKDTSTARKYDELIENEKATFEQTETDAFTRIRNAVFKNLDRERAREAYKGILEELKNAKDVKDVMGGTTVSRFGLKNNMVTHIALREAVRDYLNAKEAYEVVTEVAWDELIKGTGLDRGLPDDFIGPVKTILKKDQGGITVPKYSKPADPKQVEKEIKARITVLNKLMDAYEKLSDPKYDLSEEEIRDKLLFAYPEEADAIGKGNFVEQIKEQIELLRKLDPEDAEKLAASLGTDKIQEIIKNLERELKQQENLDKFTESVKKWNAAVEELGGEGMAYDINKIFEDYISDLEKVDIKLEEHKRMADEASTSAEGLEELAQAERDALKAATDEKLRDYFTGKAVTELTKKMDLTDWGDKSISQVKERLNDLKELIDSDFTLPEKIMEKAQKLGISIEELSKMTKEELKALYDNVDEELKKKNLQKLKFILSEINSLLGDIKSYGEISGNTGLVSAVEGISSAANVFGRTIEGFRQGGPVGAVVGFLASSASFIVKKLGEAKALSNAWKETMEQIRMDDLKYRLSLGVDGIFGSNTMRSMLNGRDMMERMKREMDALDREIGFMSFIPRDTMAGQLDDWARQMGVSLRDKNGIYNLDVLNNLRDYYKDAKDNIMVDWLDKMIADIEVYNQALEQVESAMDEVFGNIADSMADNIIDGWIEAGNAALDYADILDDVARSYAKMIIKDTILKGFFNEDTAKGVADMFMNGKTDEAMEAISGVMEMVSQAAPVFEQILSSFDPYFKREDTTSGGLSSGIKNITEEQAGLLASYMNAMRADLSVMRVLATQGWQDVKSILGLMPSPTVWDNIARIEANTYETMLSSRSILTEMQSVIGGIGSAGASSVKVEIVS